MWISLRLKKRMMDFKKNGILNQLFYLQANTAIIPEVARKWQLICLIPYGQSNSLTCPWWPKWWGSHTKPAREEEDWAERIGQIGQEKWKAMFHIPMTAHDCTLKLLLSRFESTTAHLDCRQGCFLEPHDICHEYRESLGEIDWMDYIWKRRELRHQENKSCETERH